MTLELLLFLFLGESWLKLLDKSDLWGQPREGETLTGDPLIQVHLHCILVQGTLKMRLLKTGDPL